MLQVAAFTPTDAAHVLGMQSTCDALAASKAADLFARRRDRLGKALATDGAVIAQLTIDRRPWCGVRAEAVLSATFVHDGLPADTVRQPVVQAALDRRYTTLDVSIGLHAPLVGLGASAPAYYPLVAALIAHVRWCPPTQTWRMLWARWWVGCGCRTSA